MINKFSIYSIQVSFLLLETTSNRIPPEHPVKILNTENVILSLGDVDDDTNYDLEIIKNRPENGLLEKKLYEFHKYITLAENTERPKDRIFKPYDTMQSFPPSSQIHYPDSPYEIAADERHLRMLERRIGRKKNLWGKKRKKRKRRKKTHYGIKRMDEEEGKTEEDDGRVEAITAEDVGDDAEAEYDYMAKEYFDDLVRSQKNNVAYKYSDEGKPEETIKDVFLKIFDLRTPNNCTNVTGIGVQAMECIVRNYQEGLYDKKQMIRGITFIVLIWLCIYLAIVLPLWCYKGWCCCCCRCEFCFPIQTVREIQKYILQNPPGIIRNSKGEEERYNPTHRENELYERMKRLIAEF